MTPGQTPYRMTPPIGGGMTSPVSSFIQASAFRRTVDIFGPGEYPSWLER